MALKRKPKPASRGLVFRCRVQGLGFRVLGSGSECPGYRWFAQVRSSKQSSSQSKPLRRRGLGVHGFTDWGPGFRAWGLGFRVWGLGFGF